MGGVDGILATNLVERWQDLGPVLWLIAAGAAGVWFALLGLLAAATNPRAVRPGAATLDLGGPEPPAVVNLLASDWRLAHQAIPATLLDLAARKHVAIDQYGDQTMVRVPVHPPAGGRADATPLTVYERMVIVHLRGLAADTSDGAIPAEALTTGPDEQSKSWWKGFRNAVNADARARGLSRRRWSPGVRAVLSLTALVVAVTVALAISSIPDDATSDEDDDPISAAVSVGIVSWGLLLAAVEAMAAERDTRQGREVAARWLGLREMLEEDHLFAEQPPAGVAIWDRHIAYGAALGVARGAVAALPLGAESDHEAWSPVSGRWRVVRIRYPERFPPGYGRHPFKVAALGLLQVGAAGAVLRLAPDTLQALRDAIRDTTNEQIPTALGTGLSIFLTALLTVAGLVLLRGTWMLLAGLADLIGGHQPFEGRVLRHRERHVAVDDGTANRVRAWLLPTAVGAPQGATVRARVSRRLRHVEDLEVVRGSSLAAPPGPASGLTTADAVADAVAETMARTIILRSTHNHPGDDRIG